MTTNQLLKPTLESFADEINRSTVEKLEELISLQQQSSEMAAKIEGKRNRIAALQSYIDEVSSIIPAFHTMITKA